jgi:citrate lyase subunit beta/citryl-CoA lyase
VRSLLIARADERKLADAVESGADAVVVDLARVAPAERAGARAAALRFLEETRGRCGTPALVVMPNSLDSGEIDSDLDGVMAGAPDAILLIGSLGAASVQQLSAKLAVKEAEFALGDGGTKIIAVADTAQSLLSMGGYRGASARLT